MSADDKTKLACLATLRRRNEALERLIHSVHLSRPENYLSIYQSGCNMRCRKCHSWEFTQYVKSALLQKELPADAFCMLAITMEDLYPEPFWNFVFGQASLRERVGVFSFARYDPAFYGELVTDRDHEVLPRRSLKILVHETAHMFSLTHCIYFKCVLNGSNHLEESDSRPLSVCPVCLRKLQASIAFDVADRYRRLLRFYEGKGFSSETRWVSKRLDRILVADEER